MGAPGQNLKIDPKTGDYVIVDGRPVEDNSLSTPAYIRVKAKRTQWLFAPDQQWGSDFYLYHRRHLVQDDQNMLATAAAALQPLIDAGRATSVTVVEDASNRSNYQLTATLTQSDQQTTPLTFTPVTN